MSRQDASSSVSHEAGARRAVVVANARAGTVLQHGEDWFRATIVESFERHGVTAKVVFAAGDRLEEAARAALDGPEALVVIAGGDGTISSLLPALVGGGQSVGILPLGTINLLGRDLGLSGDIAADAAVLVSGEPRRLTLGEVNGKLFHSNVGLGILGMMAREREEARRRLPFSRQASFVWAAIRTLVLARTIAAVIEVEGKRKRLRADALLITSNHFEGMPWRRTRLDQGILELHILRAPNLIARLGMVVAVLRNRWREHPALTSITTREVTIERRDRRRSTLAVDGEVERVSGPIRVRVAEAALSVIGAEQEGGS